MLACGAEPNRELSSTGHDTARLLDAIDSIKQELIAIRRGEELSQELIQRIAKALEGQAPRAVPEGGPAPSLNYRWEDLREYAELWKLAEAVADYRWKLTDLISKLTERIGVQQDENLGARIERLTYAEQRLDSIRTLEELQNWKDEFQLRDF